MNDLSRSDFTSILKTIFAKNGVEAYADDERADKFYELAQLLREGNAKTNLTAIDDQRDVIVKHFADSLLAADLFSENSSVIDVGCGAGFPTLPLAIARPDLMLTALDSTGKKIDFVKSAAKALKLGNVKAICKRAEEFAADASARENFDHATARAVSRLNILCELTLPFVKPGGSFIALKGKDGECELKEAQNGIGILGGKLKSASDVFLTDIEGEDAKRFLIEIEKVAPTPPGYPRAYAKIAKKPI